MPPRLRAGVTVKGPLGGQHSAGVKVGPMGGVTTGTSHTGALGAKDSTVTKHGPLGGTTQTTSHTGILGRTHTETVKQGPLGGQKVQVSNTGVMGATNTSTYKHGALGGNTVTQTHHGVLGGTQVNQTHVGPGGRVTQTHAHAGPLGVGATQVSTGPMGRTTVAHVGGGPVVVGGRGPVVVGGRGPTVIVAPRPGPVYYRPYRPGVGVGLAVGVAVGVTAGVAAASMSKSARVYSSTPYPKGYNSTTIIVVPNQPKYAKPFQEGKIWIELENNAPGMLTGGELRGRIHVHQWAEFEAFDLTLNLTGLENVTLTQNKVQRAQTHQIINNTYPIVMFPEYVSRVGHYTFPFTLKIPAWLPASFKLREIHDDAHMSIRYHLTAQMTPVFNKDFIGDPRNRQSVFRGQREILAFHQHMVIAPRADLRLQTQAEIHSGLLGKKESISRLAVSFERDQYYLNENVRLRINLDNTQCKKPIEKVFVSLMRTWSAKSSGHASAHKRYVKELILPGKVEKGTQQERVIDFQIPADEVYTAHLVSGHGAQADVHLYKAFKPSANVTLFKNNYVLSVFVVHDSKDKQPMSVSLPITILQPALQFGVVTYQVPQGWAPVVSDQRVLTDPIDFAELEKDAQAQAAAEAQAAQQQPQAQQPPAQAPPQQQQYQQPPPQQQYQQPPPQQQYQQPPPQQQYQQPPPQQQYQQPPPQQQYQQPPPQQQYQQPPPQQQQYQQPPPQGYPQQQYQQPPPQQQYPPQQYPPQ